MKHRAIAILAISALILSVMIWSFGTSAATGRVEVRRDHDKDAGNSRNEKEDDASEIGEKAWPAAGEEDPGEVDADLGKWGSRIDRDEYLRLRDEYIGRKRG